MSALVDGGYSLCVTGSMLKAATELDPSVWDIVVSEYICNAHNYTHAHTHTHTPRVHARAQRDIQVFARMSPLDKETLLRKLRFSLSIYFSLSI